METQQIAKEAILSAIGIQELTPEEWRDYESMRHEMLRSDPDAFPPQAFLDFQQTEEFWRERITQDIVLVAYDQKKPIGMIRATFDQDSSKIWNMFTQKEYRGLGLGKRLMGEMIEKIALRGSTTVELEVEDTQIPARTMYENVFGFKESSRAANERGGYMITMKRSL